MTDVTTALSGVLAVQAALQVISTLQPTSYLFPPSTSDLGDFHYDFVIVGGGTAGSILANRLTEIKQFNVLLVEAGDDPPLESVYPGMFVFLQNSTVDWGYKTQDDKFSSQNNRKPYVQAPAGKMLGGGSSMHHFFYIRGAPNDYEDWAIAAEDNSWNWQNLVPYFVKTQSLEDQEILSSSTGFLHGTNGYMGVTRQTDASLDFYLKAHSEVGEETILDNNGENILGITVPQMTMANGIRQGAANCFLTPILNRPNLHVLKNTEVTKLLINDNNEVYGVEAINDGSSVQLFAKKEVILAAGALNTPKILLQSGIGPKEDLEEMNITVVADLPVGKNLQDHVSSIIVHKIKESTTDPVASNPSLFPAHTIFGFTALNKSQTYPDYTTMHLLFQNNPSGILSICSSVFSFNNDICQKLFEVSTGAEVLLTILYLSRPKSHGQLRLRSTDPLDTPLIYTKFMSDERDLKLHAASLQDYVKIINCSSYQEAGAETVQLPLPNCDDLEFKSAEYWECYTMNVMDTTFHYSGTCAMGSVLDSKLRVNGVQRLRVVDASAFPNVASGNIIASVMVLAEKAADLVKDDHWLPKSNS